MSLGFISRGTALVCLLRVVCCVVVAGIGSTEAQTGAIQVRDAEIDDEKKPNEDLATEKLLNFLDTCAAVERDFACWSESRIVGVKVSTDSVFSSHRVRVLAACEQEKWRFWSERFTTGQENLPSPHWMQYLWDARSGRQTRWGVAERGRYFGKGDEQPKPITEYCCPIYQTACNRSAQLTGNANERYLVALILEHGTFLEGAYDKKTRDFFAVWSSGKGAITMEVEMHFRQKYGHLPGKVVYTAIQDGRRSIIDAIESEWEKVDGAELFVPTKITSVSENCNGSRHVESEEKIEWKTGSQAPDEIPSQEDNDWRVGFCELFGREGYSEQGKRDERAILRGVAEVTANNDG
ncbi:hypothetical protein [Rhodopirellula europaea]|uniref:hypothetical protein n=1 Tax=Rhodopirellula europaea TaxID=1263866 RepID=UPI003D2DD355